MIFCKPLNHRKCKRRGVGGQKNPNLVNVVCERPRRWHMFLIPHTIFKEKFDIFLNGRTTKSQIFLINLDFQDDFYSSTIIYFGVFWGVFSRRWHLSTTFLTTNVFVHCTVWLENLTFNNRLNVFVLKFKF